MDQENKGKLVRIIHVYERGNDMLEENCQELMDLINGVLVEMQTVRSRKYPILDKLDWRWYPK